jgi:Mg/Co/Ni transporter MgtE
VINSNVMRAKFADADYLAAVQTIVVEHGPAAGHQSASVSPRAIALREVKPHPKFGAT